MRIAVLILSICFSSILSSQERMSHLSFAWQAEFHAQKGRSIEMIISSSDPGFENALQMLGIESRKYAGRYYRLKINRDELMELLQKTEIDFIESPTQSGHLLNDTMRSMNRITPLHTGNNALGKTATGKGVLLGFIDTGIDISHPDFQDSLGRTRILHIWDQAADTLISSRIPKWGYGQVWDSSDIDAGNCPHDDDLFSHGTNVAGIAAGNGLALNEYYGAAPEADIIAVASDFSSSNWTQTVADAVEFIFEKAEEREQPCVINISAGTYLGSHDGTDLAAQRIDSMIHAEKGRVVVAAGGNAGHIPYHLGYDVGSDTNFTWFEYNPSSFLGYGAVYYQLWSDTTDFNDVHFSIGANMKAPTYAFRGSTAFDQISNRLNVLFRDSIHTGSNLLAIVETYAELQGDKYFMEVHIRQPDSSQYYYSLITTGNGRLDVWSDTWLGTSHIEQGPLPSSSVLPEIIYYKKPDSLQTIVSSFTCLPSVITVGNFVNRNQYLDVDTVLQTFNVTVGEIAATSSHGPSRRNVLKPDVSATGDYTLTANRLASIPLHIANNQSDRIGRGGFHKRNGGTSMAAPVVAGIAALMMEQCSQSDVGTIKDQIISAAFSDSLTGSVPNYSYGNGKVDALQSVAEQPQIVGIDPSGELSLCESSELFVSTSIDLDLYNWSNGGTNWFTILPPQLDSLWLEGIDSNGCELVSDTLFIISILPRPDVPVIYKFGDTLETDSASAYQWLYEFIEISGANSRRLEIDENGIYNVYVENDSGCFEMSENFQVIFVGANEQVQSKIILYPNPSSDGIYYIKTSEMEIENIIVRNQQGQLIDAQLDHEYNMIDLSAQPKGVYYLMLELKGEEDAQSFMLIRN